MRMSASAVGGDDPPGRGEPLQRLHSLSSALGGRRDSAAPLPPPGRAVALGAAPQLTKQDFRRLAPDERDPLHYLMETPASAFAAAFRHACAEIALGGRRRVAAVTSAIRGEGATTAALCLARTSAAWGRRTALIDCDLRNRTATRALGCDSPIGVWEASRGDVRMRDIQIEHRETGLWLAPAAPTDNPLRDLFSGRGFAALVRDLRASFDFVVLDLPATVGAVDAAMLAPFADATLLVAGRGRGKASLSQDAADALMKAANHPLFVLTNFAKAAARERR